jgi:hypothetical protein
MGNSHRHGGEGQNRIKRQRSLADQLPQIRRQFTHHRPPDWLRNIRSAPMLNSADPGTERPQLVRC